MLAGTRFKVTFITKQVNKLFDGTQDMDTDEWTQFLVLLLLSL